MYVNLKGKSIGVNVSESGTFYTVDGKYSAQTLKGLQKVVEEANNPIKAEVPVESIDGKKIGVVIKQDNLDGSSAYSVKWNGSKRISRVYLCDMRRRTGPAEKQRILDLEAAVTTAQNNVDAADAAYNAAESELEDYLQTLEVTELLQQVFKVKK